jgi:hypothetical protein
MGDEDKPDGSVSAIIPEFFVEIYARIIPGGVVIFLYFPELLAKANTLFRTTCVVATAFLIGAILLNFPYAVAKLCHYWLQK